MCRYVDGTLKVVRRPLIQMFSVHAFVRKDGQLKQLPLAFAVMSRRRRCDYESVLRAIVDALPQRPAVQAVVADFERAVWAAVQTVLPGVTQRGCNFHYTQAVWRNDQVVGLQTAFASDDTIHRVIRMTMALGFLPANVIRHVFEELSSSVTTGRLVDHLEYVRRNWIDSSLWPPSSWSVFRQPIRTNNDCEGWHRRLNHRAGSAQLNLYRMVQLLHSEAKLASLNVRLLSVTRVQRRAYTKLHTRISTYWDEFEAGCRSPMSLLRACGRLCRVHE